MTRLRDLHNKIDIAEATRLKELGLSNSRIAERLGVSTCGVYYALNRASMLDKHRKRDRKNYGPGYYIVNHPVWIKFLQKYKLDFGKEEPEEIIMMLEKQAD